MNVMIIPVALPLLAAPLAYRYPKLNLPALGAELILAIVLWIQVNTFPVLYVLLSCGAWFLSALFSREYQRTLHRHGRYYAFMLLTLTGTVGVFLAEDLVSLWICFECMSFASYVLVAQEEDAPALRAAASYLTYGVLGGLSILMGLLLLYSQIGTVSLATLAAACSQVPFIKLLPAGLCMLMGFGAKAGMFPLHTWLPAAHPVAPAPASALLSGVIVKTGIFGIAILTVYVFSGEASHVMWGNLLLVLALITMVLGGVLALFSVNLKRTLACSSMSQMGFVIFGLASASLLGEHSNLAIAGALLHMVNHTLFKQVLFTLAGIVMLGTGSLDLNEIRGFGRGKIGLMIAYLCAALGIGGIPLLSGYISKTLLHEGLVHYMAAAPSGWYTAAEWLFLLSGGLTLAYMIKLFVVLFVDKPAATGKTEPYKAKTTAIALLVPAVIIPVFGLFPHLTLDKIVNLSLPFFRFSAGSFIGPSYFALENLSGALISIAIGLVLYFVVVRRFLMKDGRYVNRWPVFLDLERYVYAPLVFRILPTVFGKLCQVVSDLPRLGRYVLNIVAGIFRIICDLPEIIILILRGTLFREARSHASPIAHHRFAYYFGSFVDKARQQVAILSEDGEENFYKQHENAIKFARASEEISKTTRQIFGNFSFSLIMACVGIGLVLLYIILR